MARIILALVVVGIAYYVGQPIRMWRTHRHKAQPDPRLVNLQSGAIPTESATFMLGVLESLREIGFEPLAVLDISQMVANVTMYAMMAINKGASDHALAVTAFGFADGKLKKASYSVQFVSRYANGFYIQTNNRDVSGAFPARPNSYVTKLPSVTDLARLYEVHQMLVEDHRPTAPKILRVLADFHGDVAAYLTDDMRDEFEKAQERGYLVPTADGESFRPTIKGAIIMTYMHLVPFKWIGAIARQQRERKVLVAARARGITV